ncbi:MAG: molybdopterin-dependent oxidoreductase [Firmicutes bacterium]|nr:molybdopterin-dependent oxidoreductase [Bacillota bacterium]
MTDEKVSKISRRKFLTLSTALAGGALAGSHLLPALNGHGPFSQAAASESNSGAGEAANWIPSCCNMCGGQTGVLVRVEDGRVVKIEPNPDNPIGVSNISTDYWAHKHEGAAMCPKGNAGMMSLYDPARVKRPLKRTNPEKGKGIDPRWVEVSYEEAINEVASRLRSLKDAGEAHKLVWISEDHSFTHIQDDLCELFGTPNRLVHSNLCDVGRKAGFKLVMGDERPLADMIQSRYILFFGWNPLSAVKWAHLPRIITRGIENGAKLVVVDPHQSATAAKAHEWVPIVPGTDGALALAMGHVIIRENLHDRAFIDEWVVGFDRYAEYVKNKTPEWAEEITSVPAATIERMAVEFATTKPSLADVWSGTHHTNGVQAVKAVAALAAITGQVDKPGTLINPEKKGPKHTALNADKPTQPRLDRLERYPVGHKSGVYVELFNRILDEKGPYMPKVGVVVFQNLVLAVPGTKNAIEALKKFEFLVVVDTHLSETAELADIVFPGTTYLERYDLNSNWVTWSTVGLRQPVVSPVFGQLPEYELVKALGKALQLTDKDGNPFFDDLNYEDYLSKELQEGGPKMSLEDLKRLPGACWVDSKGTQYEKFKKQIPADKLEGTSVDQDGIIKDKDGKPVGFMKRGVPTGGFNTSSRKLELYSKNLEGVLDANGKRINPLPLYEPREWQPSDEYPLYLVNWKEISHTHTRTFNNPFLMEVKPSNPLIMNASTARRLGIEDGDLVWVESPYAKDKATVHVTQGMHPLVVGWQHGFGHWGFGRVAKDKGTNDGQFLPTKACPISGQALNKECCVKVYKA